MAKVAFWIHAVLFAYLRLNGIQLAETLQCFIRQSRRRTDVYIVDFTAGVSPTSGFRYPAIAVQFVEPGVSICLQHTAEAGKIGLRVDAFSVGTGFASAPAVRRHPHPGGSAHHHTLGSMTLRAAAVYGVSTFTAGSRHSFIAA